MPKRNRVISRLLLPLAIFLWFIGWSIAWLGSKMEMKRKTAIPHPKLLNEKDVTFIVPCSRAKGKRSSVDLTLEAS
jgi:hypothetical protein